jgi:hypothetical protein
MRGVKGGPPNLDIRVRAVAGLPVSYQLHQGVGIVLNPSLGLFVCSGAVVLPFHVTVFCSQTEALAGLGVGATVPRL